MLPTRCLLQSAWKAQFEPELGLLIQLVLYKFSVWDQGSSYGAKLQGLKYAPPPGSRSRIGAPSPPARSGILDRR